jgi:hypothetical protein
MSLLLSNMKYWASYPLVIVAHLYRIPEVYDLGNTELVPVCRGRVIHVERENKDTFIRREAVIFGRGGRTLPVKKRTPAIITSSRWP